MAVELTGSQDFKLWLRKTAGTPNPTVDVQLYENGSLVSTLLNDTAITSTTGQLVTAPWDASAVSAGNNGSAIECRVVSTPGTAAPALPVLETTAGTLLDNATLPATYNVNIPAHSSGDLLILLVLARNTNNDGGFTINTANWTRGGGGTTMYGGAQNARIGFGWKIGDGSETAVDITGTGGTGTDRIKARVFRVTSTTGFASTPVQFIGTATNGSGTTVTCPTVTPGGAKCLAMALFGMSVSTTMAAPTNESGGDWTEPIAESAGTNGTIGLLRSDQSGGGTISGGTFTITSAAWVGIGFGVVPGPGAAVNTVEVGAIEWNAQFNTTGETVTLDTAAAVATASDTLANLSVAADTAAVAAAAADLTILEARTVTLDTAAVTAAAEDVATSTPSTIVLDTASISAAAEDVAAHASILVDTAAVAAAGEDIATATVVTLDTAVVTAAAADLQFPASPIAAVNANVTLEVDRTYWIRFRLENTGGAADGTGFQLAFNHQSGGWTAATTSSSFIRAVSDPAFADGDDVPEVLGGTGSYVTNNDSASEDGAVTLPANLAAGSSVEPVFAFQVRGADMSLNETGQLKLRKGDGTDLDSYTAIITYTVAENAALIDTAAIAASAADLAASVAVSADLGAATAAASDILASTTVVLDAAAVAASAGDLAASQAVLLDTAAITAAADDVAARTALEADTAAVTASATDVAAHQLVALEDAPVAVAAADVAPLEAGATVLDTAAITVVAEDLTIVQPVTVVLDVAAATVTADDTSPNIAVLLDTVEASAAGADLTAATTVALEDAAVVAAASNVSTLAAGSVAIDDAVISVAAADLVVLAPQILTLDTAAVVAAAVDIPPGQVVSLDVGAVAAAADDFAQIALSVPLEPGAVLVAAGDALPQIVQFELEAATVTVAASDVSMAAALEAEAAAVSVAAEDVTFGQVPTLDQAEIAVAAEDVAIVAGELGQFGPRQRFVVAVGGVPEFTATFDDGQDFGVVFSGRRRAA